MKRFLYFLAPLAIILIIYSLMGGSSDQDYVEQIMNSRSEKEHFLRNNSESPFVIKQMEMKDLNYYPIDENYRVIAKVEKIKERSFVVISNSDGSSQRYLKYALLHFEINDQPSSLTVLKPVFGVDYFLGFADETSGSSTYGAGRFLDINELRSDRVTLDFNLAYNPYCAYDPNFVCPFPPRENTLAIEIKAGEMKY